MATLLVSHPSFLEHDTGPHHPERPDRLRAILAALDDPAFAGLVARRRPGRLDGRADARSSAGLCRGDPRHPPRPGEHVHVDGDTVMSQGSAEAALRAAGAVVAGVEAVMEGAGRRRPSPRSVRPAITPRPAFPAASACSTMSRSARGTPRRSTAWSASPSSTSTSITARARRPSSRPTPTCSTPRRTSIRSIPAPASPRERGIANNVVNVPLAAGAGGAEFRAAWGERILPALDALRARARDRVGGLRRPSPPIRWRSSRSRPRISSG